MPASKQGSLLGRNEVDATASKFLTTVGSSFEEDLLRSRLTKEEQEDIRDLVAVGLDLGLPEFVRDARWALIGSIALDGEGREEVVKIASPMRLAVSAAAGEGGASPAGLADRVRDRVGGFFGGRRSQTRRTDRRRGRDDSDDFEDERE